MSAIAILRPSARMPDAQSRIDRMADALSHRGQRQTFWSDGEIFIGHRQFANSTASPHFYADNEIVVAGDMRLDRMALLGAKLAPELSPSSEAALVARAYRRWGEDFIDHVEGDFALAVFDRRQGRLFLVRDRFGVRPLYYVETSKYFAAASELPALLSLPGAADELDEVRIAGAVAGAVLDAASTSYRRVKRLEAAHMMEPLAGGTRRRRYWILAPAERAAGGDIYGELCALLDEATRARMGAEASTGAFLSGGIDSSAIALLAARNAKRPFPTVSLVYDATPDLSERPYIEAVAANPAIAANFVDGGDINPFHHIAHAVHEQGEAFLAPGMGVVRTLYESAGALGLSIMLDGHGGDEVISQGFGRLNDLRRARKWLALWSELRAPALIYGKSRAKLFLHHLQYESPMVRRLTRAKRKLWQALGLETALPPSALARQTLVNSTLAKRAHLEERLAVVQPSPDISEPEAHLWELSSPVQSYALETLDHVAFAQGVEPRFPFWDRDVVQFCLSLPGEAKLKNGWPRWALRQGAAGLMPDAIRWRRSKLDFTPHLISGILRYNQDALNDLVHDRAGLDGFINMDVLRRAIVNLQTLGARTPGRDVQSICRAQALAVWLSAHVRRDLAPVQS